MKLRNVLKEDGAALTYRDLSPLQVNLLKKLASGELSVETAHERLSGAALAALTHLQDLGLIGPDEQLSQAGERALAIANRLGSVARRDASKMDSKLGRQGGNKAQRYTDVDDGSEVPDEAGGFRDRWEDVRSED